MTSYWKGVPVVAITTFLALPHPRHCTSEGKRLRTRWPKYVLLVPLDPMPQITANDSKRRACHPR